MRRFSSELPAKRRPVSLEDSSLGELFPSRKAKLADPAAIHHLIPTCSQQQSVPKPGKACCLFEQDSVYIQIFERRRQSQPPKTHTNTRFSHTKWFLISSAHEGRNYTQTEAFTTATSALYLQRQKLKTKSVRRFWGNENFLFFFLMKVYYWSILQFLLGPFLLGSARTSGWWSLEGLSDVRKLNGQLNFTE